MMMYTKILAGDSLPGCSAFQVTLYMWRSWTTSCWDYWPPDGAGAVPASWRQMHFAFNPRSNFEDGHKILDTISIIFIIFIIFFCCIIFFFIQFRTKKIIRWIFCFFFVWLHLLNFDGGKKWRTDFIFLFLHFRFWCVNNVRFCLNFCFCLSLSLFLLRWRGWRGSEGIWLGSRDLSSREIHVSY